MKSLHSIQIKILQDLLYKEYIKYSDLKPKEMEGSQFTFHLEALIKESLIKKSSQGYSLTAKGKEVSNRMDYGDIDIKTQAKISAVLCCIREEDGVTQYLLYTRKKNPFWGYQGFPTGKVKRGEDISEAATRELLEEANLDGIPELFAIRHYRIYSNEDLLLEDKIFFAFRFKNPKGKLTSGKEGDFKVKLKSAQKMELPEINDEFAKGMGAFDALVALKESMKQGLTAEKTEAEKQRKRGEILEKIAEKTKLELPETMVDYEKQRLLEDLKNKVTQNMKITFEQYLSAVKQTKEALAQTFQKEAEKRLKGFLVLRELGKKENIEVSDAEAQKEVEKATKNYSKEDLEKIQDKAIKSGIPYQTLISSLIRQYANGRISLQI